VGDFFGKLLSLPVNNSWQPNKEKKMNRPKLIIRATGRERRYEKAE
jgi:hypothetical protein